MTNAQDTRPPIIIENVGPIEKLVLQVPKAGIVVLQGRNGVGKSHALQAISALFDKKVKLSKRDHSDQALVKAFGATITLRRSTSYQGQLEAHTISGRYDLASAVDPGIDDPVAADRVRIKSLLSIAGVTLTKKHFLPLTSDDTLQQSLLELQIDEELLGPAEMADLVKRHFEAEARVHEKKAEMLRGKVLTLSTLMEENPEPISLKEAQQEYQQAVVECQAAQKIVTHTLGQLELYKNLSAQIEFLEKEIGVEDEQQLEEDILNMEKEIASRKQQIEELKMQIARIEERHTQLVVRLKKIKNVKNKIATLRSQLPEKPDPFDEELVTKAQNKLKLAEQKVQKAERYQEYLDRKEEIRKLEASMEEEQKRAAEARKAASDINVILARALSQLGQEFYVQDQRLVIKTDRGWEPFAELSFGEKWKTILQVVTRQMDSSGVLVVPQEAWEGIDPVNRKELAALASQFQVLIITAEATEADSIQGVLFS